MWNQVYILATYYAYQDIITDFSDSNKIRVRSECKKKRECSADIEWMLYTYISRYDTGGDVGAFLFPLWVTASINTSPLHFPLYTAVPGI